MIFKIKLYKEIKLIIRKKLKKLYNLLFNFLKYTIKISDSFGFIFSKIFVYKYLIFLILYAWLIYYYYYQVLNNKFTHILLNIY